MPSTFRKELLFEAAVSKDSWRKYRGTYTRNVLSTRPCCFYLSIFPVFISGFNIVILSSQIAEVIKEFRDYLVTEKETRV